MKRHTQTREPRQEPTDSTRTLRDTDAVAGISRRGALAGGVGVARGLGLGSLLEPAASMAATPRGLFPKYNKRWHTYFATHADALPFWAPTKEQWRGHSVASI